MARDSQRQVVESKGGKSSRTKDPPRCGFQSVLTLYLEAIRVQLQKCDFDGHPAVGWSPPPGWAGEPLGTPVRGAHHGQCHGGVRINMQKVCLMGHMTCTIVLVPSGALREWSRVNLYLFRKHIPTAIVPKHFCHEEDSLK